MIEAVNVEEVLGLGDVVIIRFNRGIKLIILIIVGYVIGITVKNLKVVVHNECVGGALAQCKSEAFTGHNRNINQNV